VGKLSSVAVTWKLFPLFVVAASVYAFLYSPAVNLYVREGNVMKEIIRTCG